MIHRFAVLLLILCSLPALAKHAYTEIDARAETVGITGNSPAWHHQEVGWAYHAADGAAYYTALGHDERFKLQDNSLEGGLHSPISKRWAFDAMLAVSPEHHFLPQDSLFAGLDYAVSRSWILHAGIRHSHYQDSQANIASLGAAAYIGTWRLAYTLYDGASGGASGASHVLEADWYYGNLSFVGLVLVRGRQVDRIDSTHIVITPVDGFTLKGKQAVSSNWALTYTLGLTSLKAFYTRRGVSVGIAYRF